MPNIVHFPITPLFSIQPELSRVYDGWCVYSAIAAEQQFIPVPERERIPLYVPPGGYDNEPFGIAGNDCPYTILGKGTGLKPLHEYTKEDHPNDVISHLWTFTGQKRADKYYKYHKDWFRKSCGS